MRYLFGFVLCVALALTSAGNERQRVASPGDEAPQTADASPAIEFPTIADDQRRRIATEEIFNIDPVDPAMSGGVVDACKSGNRRPDQACRKDNNVYYCIISARRICGMYLEGTSSQVCATCLD